jgi:hypothetical protein
VHSNFTTIENIPLMGNGLEAVFMRELVVGKRETEKE